MISAHRVPGALQEVSFAIGKPVSAVKAAGDLLALERKRGTKEGIARALLLVTSAVIWRVPVTTVKAQNTSDFDGYTWGYHSRNGVISLT